MWFDNDPVLDFDDVLEDFLLDGDDDYFDQQSPAKRKRRTDAGNARTQTNEGTVTPSKRGKLLVTKRVTDESAPHTISDIPVVVWRTPCHNSLPYPTFRNGTEAKVALLKDWRERVKLSASNNTGGGKRRPGQTAFAVVVERRQSKDLGNGFCTPSMDIDKGSIVKTLCKQKEAKPRVNRASVAVRSTSNESNKRASAGAAVNRPALAQQRNPTSAASLKRKAASIDDEEDELQADDGGFAKVKERTVTEQKGPAPSSLYPQASVTKKQKRKASGPELDASTTRAKRKAPEPKADLSLSSDVVDLGKIRSTRGRSTRKKI